MWVILIFLTVQLVLNTWGISAVNESGGTEEEEEEESVRA